LPVVSREELARQVDAARARLLGGADRYAAAQASA
jgi:hypothetical protein